MANKFGLPDFVRLEIPLGGRKEIIETAEQLRALAHELDQITAAPHNESTVSVLAYHAIRDVSKRKKS